MELYLDAVKGKDVDIDELHKLSNGIYSKWPTFLNTVATRGKEYWVKYINKDNYHLTLQYYSSGLFPDFTNWICSRSFTDKHHVARRMASFSENTDIFTEYIGSLRDIFTYILPQVYRTDNVNLLKGLFFIQNVQDRLRDERNLVVILEYSMQYAFKYEALKCLHFLLSLSCWDHHLWEFATCKKIALCQDNSLIFLIKGDLDSTNFIGNSPEFKIAMVGSRAEVKEVLVSKGDHESFLYCLANRISNQSIFADDVLQYATEKDLVLDSKWNDDFASHLLTSSRPNYCTRKIIQQLNQRGIVFTKGTQLNIYSMSVQSWIAVMSDHDLFDFEIVSNKDPSSINYRLLLPQNGTILRNILRFISKRVPQNIFITFCILAGSSHSQWCFKQGYFAQDIDVSNNMINMAGEIGNLIMLALLFRSLESSPIPPKIEDYYKCEKFMNFEAEPFIDFWLNAGESEKIFFITQPFGCNFCDSSEFHNRNFACFGGRRNTSNIIPKCNSFNWDRKEIVPQSKEILYKGKYIPKGPLIDHYLEVVKGNNVNIEKIERTLSVRDEQWPTYLNCVAAYGKPEDWKKHLTRYNYHLTGQQYTSPLFPEFRNWLMEQSFSNNDKIIRELVQSSCDADQLLKYYRIYTQDEDKRLFLSAAYMTDNTDVLFIVLDTDYFGPVFTRETLKSSMTKGANLCTRRLCKLINSCFGDLMDFPPSIFVDLYNYKDHTAVLDLKHILSLTYDDSENPFNWETRGLKVAMLGNEREVDLALKNKPTQRFICCLLSRIAHEEVFANLIAVYLKNNNFQDDDDYNTTITSYVLSSNRDVKDTVKIINSLNGLGIVFTKETRLDITNISPNSWKALMLTRNKFDLTKAFMSGDLLHSHLYQYKYNDDVHCILRDMAVHFSPQCKIDIYIAAGTSRAHRAHNEGLFNNFPEITLNMVEKVLTNGNVFMLGIFMETEEKKIFTEFLMSKSVHLECLKLLSFWEGSTKEQREHFFTNVFSDNFFDNSIYVNGKVNTENERYASTYLTRHKFKSIIPDC